VSGTDTTLNFGAGTDDATAPVALPFAFPFAGVPYTDAAASTNGWLAFGGPAWDYYDDNQTGDFRGVPAVVGELYRGLMPLWSDLSIAQGGGLTTPGSVRRIVAADGTVALRWDVRYLSGGRATSFQAVLFPDGRVRYDYLGTSAGAENLGNKTIVGLSAGTGTPDLFAQDVLSPPSSSVLYTPRAVDTPTAPAGTLRVTLPRLSTFVSAPDGCAVTTAPTATRAGAVDCAIGALAAGESAIRAVAWTLGTVPGGAGPENTDESARWTAGDASAQDADTLGLAAAMPSSTAITAALGFGPTPTAAVPFDMTLTTTSGSLVHPVLEVDVPAGLEVVAAPAALLCDAPPAAGAAGTLTCRPRNGGGAADASGTFTVRAAVAGDYAVTARVGADNGAAQATATQTVTVAP
jgi:hypothetical protein